MNEIQSTVLAFLPSRRKSTTGGWLSFNAVCCHHKGESQDKRGRGGLLLTEQGGFTYSCFNCQFKAGWAPGKLLSKNARDLFRWVGLPEIEIQKLNLLALKLKDDQPVTQKTLNFELEQRDLPNDCLLIDDWIKEGCEDPELLAVVDYIINRGMEWDWYPWHWSASPGYKDRVIIPFYQNGKIVGSTGRKIRDGKPKYLTDSQNGYVFNIDRQLPNKKFALVVEGQFDAIGIDGVGIMTNEPNDIQCARISSLGREVIVVPDRDRAGAKLIQAAINNNWSVSFPPWEDNIKDVADAVKKYGRIYTLYSILHYKESNKIKNQILEKKLEKYE